MSDIRVTWVKKGNGYLIVSGDKSLFIPVEKFDALIVEFMIAADARISYLMADREAL